MHAITTSGKLCLTQLIIVFMLISTCPSGLAHERGPRGAVELEWKTPQIARVTAPVFSVNNLGYYSAGFGGRVVEIAGRNCLQGSQFAIDVADEFLFNINARVELDLEFYQAAETKGSFSLAYDINGGIGGIIQKELEPAKAAGMQVQRLSLPKARFANRGDFHGDLLIVGGKTNAPFAFASNLTVCGIRLRPVSNASPVDDTTTSRLTLTVIDEHGDPTPARIGIYDANKRALLPGDDAIALAYFDETRSSFRLAQRTPWPHTNPYVFYSSGKYRSAIAPGEYRIVVGKGPEYRFAQQQVTIVANREANLTIELQRWRDLPAQGWYSGDAHIHITREQSQDSSSRLLHTMAEDVHVANLLQMGNIALSHFPQSGDEAGSFPGPYRLTNLSATDYHQASHNYLLVSGQEDPRSDTRGHTSHLNLKHPVRFPDEYLLYHRVFEAVAEQGGVSGYAHTIGTGSGVREGMAIDIPFHLVDFVEVLQTGILGTANWFDFLNLGYRISPAAGTDYPYLADVVGGVRTYVHVDQKFSASKWFENFAKGRSFVSSGPVLNFNINGQTMGSVVDVEPGSTLMISADAAINPDIDLLDRLELIKHGQVIAQQHSAPGAETLSLSAELKADVGAWYVVRAYGKQQQVLATVAAVSSPIYVTVNHGETWLRDSVAPIAEGYITLLQNLRDNPPLLMEGENWWTQDVWGQQRLNQKALLNKRIDQAIDRLNGKIDAAK